MGPRHDASLDLIEDHLPPERDQGVTLVTRDGSGCAARSGGDLLLGGHLLALQYVSARLADHALFPTAMPLPVQALPAVPRKVEPLPC
ncbi:MAG TPA: hypothetical protein VGF67_00150 [Ktedonobacteraceae bacterium]